MPKVNFVVALAAEAKPLIRHFGLTKALDNHAFAVYRSKNINLIISGPGKVLSATACGLLACSQQSLQDSPHGWINIGIAGHATFERGNIIMAQRITDAATGNNFFPQCVYKTSLPSANLITADAPQQQYPTDAMVDMEASGFFQAASRFSTLEFIHSIKVISDNTSKPIKHINAKYVTALITQNIAAIDEFYQALHLLLVTTHCYNPHVQAQETELQRLAAIFHYSFYEQEQLKRLLKRWLARFNDKPTDYLLSPAIKSTIKTKKDVLRQLEARLLSHAEIDF